MCNEREILPLDKMGGIMQTFFIDKFNKNMNTWMATFTMQFASFKEAQEWCDQHKDFDFYYQINTNLSPGDK